MPDKIPRNFPRTYKIEGAVKETSLITTLLFKIEKIAREAKPGQFVMVWVPNVNEKPMSLSYIEEDRIGITVQKVGRTTSKLCDKRVREYVGIRGPYGIGFDYAEISKALIIGGGVGIAPLVPLAERISGKGHVTTIIGAKTASELIFLDRLEKVCERVIPITEDGSFGLKGLLTDILPGIVGEDGFDKAFMCGPEVMMAKGVEILREFDISGEVSLVRWMKCGVGICGQCVLDPTGLRVCKEGPVFDLEIISNTDEFGEYRRLSSGIKCKIK